MQFLKPKWWCSLHDECFKRVSSEWKSLREIDPENHGVIKDFESIGVIESREIIRDEKTGASKQIWRLKS